MAIDWSAHPTHHRVRRKVRREANRIQRLGASRWNTYYDHPVGYGLDDVSVDHWGEGGRGTRIKESVGNAIVQRVLNRRQKYPVAWLIWFRRIWTPAWGWQPYNGWSGAHEDHVHVTYNYYSRTAGRWP